MAQFGAGKCLECEKDIVVIEDAYFCVFCEEDGPYCSGKCLDAHMIANHDKPIEKVRCVECNLDLTNLAFEVITVSDDHGNESKMCKGCYYAGKMAAHFSDVPNETKTEKFLMSIYSELYLANDIEFMRIDIAHEIDNEKRGELIKDMCEYMLIFRSKYTGRKIPEEEDGS